MYPGPTFWLLPLLGVPQCNTCSEHGYTHWEQPLEVVLIAIAWPCVSWYAAVLSFGRVCTASW